MENFYTKTITLDCSLEQAWDLISNPEQIAKRGSAFGTGVHAKFDELSVGTYITWLDDKGAECVRGIITGVTPYETWEATYYDDTKGPDSTELSPYKEIYSIVKRDDGKVEVTAYTGIFYRPEREKQCVDMTKMRDVAFELMKKAVAE